MTLSREDADRFEATHGRRPTFEERGVVASAPRKKGERVKADWENTQQFESLKASETDWIDFFDRRPDVLHAILGDVYIATKYDERKRETGQRLDGRRVMPRNASLQELNQMITPRYSMQPFPLAVAELKGERSLRQFASRVPMDHRELSRMIRGVAEPSTYWMERIASSYSVAPAYFLEWRIQFVTARLVGIFTERPNLSVGVVKRLRGAPGR